MLLNLIGCYRRKKTRKSLDLQAFLVFLGFIKTLIWWRRGELNLAPNYMYLLDMYIVGFV